MTEDFHVEIENYFHMLRKRNDIYFCDQLENVESKFSDEA